MSGSPGRTRTSDQLINSQSLYQLSYRGKLSAAPQHNRVGILDQPGNQVKGTQRRTVMQVPGFQRKARCIRSTASRNSSCAQAKEIRM